MTRAPCFVPALFALVAAAACTVKNEPPPAVATAGVEPVALAPPDPAPPPPPPAPAPPSALDQAARRAIEAADRDGWIPKQTVQIQERNAVVVLYEPKPESAPATKAMRADAIGVTGAPYTIQSGIIDVVKSPNQSVLWNLTGDGPRFVILNLVRCEPHCGAPAPVVLELSPRDEFSRAKSAPQCPTCIQDADRDGVPEFTFRMVELEIAPCSRVSCGPEVALRVQVRGFESWDGARFARNLRSFVPLYDRRLQAARAEVKRVRKASKKKTTCPLDAVRVAAELFAYGRLTGVTELAAFKEADTLMAGYSTAPCSREFDLLARPRSWVELRSELVSEKLPVLDADRAR
jgi:hypothetical protein